jgi:hypothetical protein
LPLRSSFFLFFLSKTQADKPDVTALMSKASAEQKELATDVYHLLTTYEDEDEE